MKTQRAQSKRSRLPAGGILLADPEHLNHQEDPLKEHDDGDDQHNPLLGGPWSNTHDGEDDGKTSSPDGAVEESTDCDGHISGWRVWAVKGSTDPYNNRQFGYAARKTDHRL